MTRRTAQIVLNNVPLGRSVVLGLSGGADSVALLMLLLPYARDGRIQLSAAHMEHGLRGEDSVSDMRFVEELCKRENVPLAVRRVSVPDIARSRGIGLEQAAREERYAFLRSLGADVIALAHHADDQAESILMHLFRGSGRRGAIGMAEAENGIWRPLLRVGKDEIISYLRERNIPWREDATNVLCDTPRNILRGRAVPAIREAYAALRGALTRFADVLRGEDALLDDLARECAEKNAVQISPACVRIETEGVPIPLLRRVLHFLTGTTLAETDRMLLAGKGADIARYRAEYAGSALYITQTGTAEEEYALNEVFGIEPCAPVPIKKDDFRQALNERALDGAIVRTRRAGDAITPLGMRGTKTLSDFFTDKKVEKPLRDQLLLVAKGNEILWIPSLCVSRYAAVTPDARAVRLTMKEEYKREVRFHA